MVLSKYVHAQGKAEGHLFHECLSPRVLSYIKHQQFLFLFLFIFVFPHDNRHVSCKKKEAGNLKSDMPIEIGISFFEMPHILQRIDSTS
jgi:hypothetical protein